MIYQCKKCGKDLPLSVYSVFHKDKKKFYRQIYQRKSFCSSVCQMRYLWMKKRDSQMKNLHSPEINLAHSQRMKKKNPMKNPVWKEKARQTMLRMGHRPKVRGSNGQPMPIPQRILLAALGEGWYAEHAIPTHSIGLKTGYATCYKIDIANPILKISVEVDGPSHNTLLSKKRDKKKTRFLEGIGWKVLRFKNKRILQSLISVLKDIQAMS